MRPLFGISGVHRGVRCGLNISLTPAICSWPFYSAYKSNPRSAVSEGNDTVHGLWGSKLANAWLAQLPYEAATWL